ncbi:hypothetical protein MCC93_07350 [Morococcus cerebrosus]|uniref:Uncharacterized protein n=1 Tax=Morococcus cerebrosus TaxID=1056807 RepID=A0A0C1GYR4_9NEIS|nr:hypothetical protein MCC93_07350 [Morococcus cerebrosus]
MCFFFANLSGTYFIIPFAFLKPYNKLMAYQTNQSFRFAVMQKTAAACMIAV